MPVLELKELLEHETKMKKRSFTDHSFALPSFLYGMARIFDLGATFSVSISDNPDKEDFLAIYSDWATTGNDIRESIKIVLDLEHGEEEDK